MIVKSSFGGKAQSISRYIMKILLLLHIVVEVALVRFSAICSKGFYGTCGSAPLVPYQGFWLCQICLPPNVPLDFFPAVLVLLVTTT